jgi:hypothetical protein
MWGVRAASLPRFEVTEDLIHASAARVVELGWLKPGERVGITAGPALGQAGYDQPAADPGRLKGSGPRSGAGVEPGLGRAELGDRWVPYIHSRAMRCQFALAPS